MKILEQKTTILFDLDGTLLPLDIDQFLEKYFQLLAQQFSDIAAPEEFITKLMAATDKMINNQGAKTNQEVFVSNFGTLFADEKESDLVERFEKFYQHKFPLLRKGIEADPKVVEIIEKLKGSNYKLVVATNPLFPRLAIEERIKWAGLEPNDFDLITSSENMHHAKPNLGYYKEILEKIAATAEECIMVGNDLGEDMVAQKLGIDGFLIEDFLIDRDEAEDIKPQWQGSLKEFKNLIID
ncbi:HAD family hydrolase [Natroniella sulfidigena]|uniref:HAD family hydrolase n=1 Tax=Natroniella sulfidigena TaxID=723921 RepID=UPI00200A9CCC|nr:HAD family hydrolase [Natroniella sulfidigena]MCK8816950.1 HAD family hydrolase [Natroniella sulfidigena]